MNVESTPTIFPDSSPWLWTRFSTNPKTECDSLNRPQIRYTGYDLDETGCPA